MRPFPDTLWAHFWDTHTNTATLLSLSLIPLADVFVVIVNIILGSLRFDVKTYDGFTIIVLRVERKTFPVTRRQSRTGPSFELAGDYTWVGYYCSNLNDSYKPIMLNLVLVCSKIQAESDHFGSRR